ncbi:metallophosphoesterase [Enterobacter soli]|uniref:metallophosphoesterase n=1 Tax=Enterobacter soli TaxID=885040 RepID=UPI003EDB5F36
MLIAQISDIHAAPDNDNLARFDQALAWLEQLSPDGVVLTGDLTDNHWLEGYKLIADRLQQQNYPSWVLPGNSDSRYLMRAVWGEKTWALDAPDDALHFVHNAGSFQLIGIDSTVAGQDYGSVDGHLEWLNAQLSRADAPPSLLFLHHPVIASGIPTLDATRCRGLKKLEECIHNTPGRLLAISAGHVHRPVAGLFAGIPAYICSAVCPANPLWFGTEDVPPVEKSPGLMIHRYVDHELSSHFVCV